MSVKELGLNVVFKQAILNCIAEEQHLNSLVKKLAKATFTPELCKALSPDSTNFSNHIARLKLIATAIESKSIRAALVTSILSLPKLGPKHATQDLAITKYAIELISLKIAQYELLQSLAIASKSAQFDELLLQCLSENRDTKTWLRQLVQNVIAPNLVNP